MIRAVLAILLALAGAAAEARPLWLVDFVYLAEGYGPAEHDAFAANAAVIAARHGIRRRISLDRVAGFAHPGPIAPDRIDLWSVPDRAAFAAWTDDPDRVWYEDLAGHILDGQSSRYLARERSVAAFGTGGFYLVDLPRLRAGAGAEAVAAYGADLARAGRRHGLAEVAVFGDIAHLSGLSGRIDLIRIWHLPDRAALDALLADPAYRGVESRRPALYDFGGSARQLYRASLVFTP